MADETDKLSALFGPRYEIIGVLKTLSPLHVGTGDAEVITGVGGRAGDNDPPGVARIVVDYEGKPYLPATTIKGMLRKIGEEILERNKDPKKDPIYDLFGVVKKSADEKQKETDKSGIGAMGALLARGATLKEAGDASGFPYAKTAGAILGKGVFVAARTAIDPLAGVAADAKLYFQEMVAPGARFKLRLTLLAGRDGETRLRNLLAVLSRLAADNGVPCGRGQADGAGALKLVSLNIVTKSIGADGALQAESENDHDPRPAPRKLDEKHVRTLIFHCQGPFLSLDSSWVKNPDDNNEPQLNYQHGADNRPLALGSQIAGALRARARWIAGLRALKELQKENGGKSIAPEDIARKIDPSSIGVSRVVRTRADAKDLTIVERLFGVTGFAGLLRIERMRFFGGEEFDITSVKLDHFSGAPIDKALFKTRAVRGARLELALALRERPGEGAATPRARALFRLLLCDLKRNGLMLGRGSNKGFGWFEYKKDASHAG